jgi:gliding motility-associated-like protein
MRLSWIILLIIGLSLKSSTQNLIPNGSFEQTTNLNYTDPDNGFSYVDDWYRANFITQNPTFRGTPDLFDQNNRWPLSYPDNFWNRAWRSAEGEFHAGIANLVNKTGFYQPETMATPLVQPLEAGAFYQISLQARNKGVGAYLDNIPIVCVADEDKRIDILLHSDSIWVTIDGNEKNSFHNAEKQISLRHEALKSQLLVGWTNIGTCFQADGSEQFLGVTTNTGEFSVIAPCVIYDEHWDVFYIFYFDIDDIKLTKLPETIHLTQEICKDRRTKINIAELANLPSMQDEIQFHWSDGKVDSVNYFSEASTVNIDAILDCTTIPITLEITETRCDPNIFVPNTFTPNNDGLNDELETFIVVDIPILEYKFSVFDRLGALLFTTNDMNQKWDGTFQGQKMPNGVYIWLLEYQLDDFEKGIVDFKEAGDVTILRDN